MSAMSAPAAPRAMLTAASTPHLEQVFATATETLYPRLLLFEALSRFKKEQEKRSPSGDDIVEARRDFLDSFAYLCDLETGGKTVTAAGLQQLPYGNFLWLAANEGVRNDVKDYAERIMSILKSVDSNNERAIEETVFQIAVECCQPRILTYREKVRKHATNCRMQLRYRERTDTGERNLLRNSNTLFLS
jgi:hypothetical protein